MKKGFILSLGTLSIDNETDDDDASQSRPKGFVFGGENEV